MLKKSNFMLFSSYSLLPFVLMACALFILGMGTTSAQAAKKADAPKGVAASVDINNATQKELEDIKGVGPAMAKKIIAGRPYKSVDELSKAGINAKAIEKLKPLVTVGKAAAAPVKAAEVKPASAVKSKTVEAKKTAGGLVDINSATQKELEDIKGVGPAMAKKIIAGRPYKSVDELSKAGINAKAIEKMKPLITVGKVQVSPVPAPAAKLDTKATIPPAPAAKAAPQAAASVSPVAANVTKAPKDIKAADKSKPAAATKLSPGTKININTADQATIEKLPEIGPVKAKAIIAGRPYKTIEDVMKIKGIKDKTFDAIKDYIVVK